MQFLTVIILKFITLATANSVCQHSFMLYTPSLLSNLCQVSQIAQHCYETCSYI